MRDIRVAVTGFGNVGRGLCTLLVEHGSRYERQYGVRILLTGAADRGGAAVDRAGIDPSSLLNAKEREGTVAAHAAGTRGMSGREFLQRAGADVLVEAASTNFTDAEPGWSYSRDAIDLGMDLILASKGALALHYADLMRRAAEANRSVLFSATVGAPVPSLQLVDRVLVGARILAFEGIFNGTTHQILSAMSRGASYEAGVREAQQMGIAEADPTLDVDGWDAAAKVAIIANAVFGGNLTVHDVPRKGIRGVTAQDLAEAHRGDEAIKLIGRAWRDGDRIETEVTPERRPVGDALGRLQGDDMGIVFLTEPFGAIATTVEPAGHGGGITTAMTVLRDLFNLARDRGWMELSAG